jgi:hypothetical protein
LIWYDKTWYDMLIHDMIWCDMIRHDMKWYYARSSSTSKLDNIRMTITAVGMTLNQLHNFCFIWTVLNSRCSSNADCFGIGNAVCDVINTDRCKCLDGYEGNINSDICVAIEGYTGGKTFFSLIWSFQTFS